METTARSYAPAAGRVIFLLVALSVARVSGAQEVQIMINGPWGYVEDPSDSSRVVVVGALSANHGPAEIFSGEEATQFTGKTAPLPGKFRLDFPTSSCGSATGTSSGAFQVNGVGKSLITQVIDDRKNYHPEIRRYTISLPKPCFYKSHKQSRSRVDPNTGNPPHTEGSYTIWMELHYQVSGVSSATLRGDSDDGTVSYNDRIKFTNVGSGATPAISVAISTPASESDLECDSHSVESFVQSNVLFGLNLEGQFPILDANGNQTNSYSTNARCIGRTALAHMDSVKLSREALIKIEQFKGYLTDPSKLPGLDARGTLEKIRSSVADLHGGRIPDDLEKELRSAGKLLDEIEHKSGAQEPTPVEHRDYGKTDAAAVLVKAEFYFSITSVGSGDCHQGEISINAVAP